MYLHPARDGETHININFRKAKTRLGTELSNLANTPFIIDGQEYASVEALWYELTLPDNVPSDAIICLRKLHGSKAKSCGQQLQAKFGKVHRDGFKLVIREAFILKIQCRPRLRKLLLSSDLPITHYLWDGKITAPTVTHFPKHQWMNDLWMELRQQIKDGTL